jgi:hypothetical protein
MPTIEPSPIKDTPYISSEQLISITGDYNPPDKLPPTPSSSFAALTPKVTDDYTTPKSIDVHQSKQIKNTIIRIHHSDTLIETLKRIIDNYGTPDAEMFYTDFFKTIRIMRRDLLDEPFMIIIDGIYNAMTYGKKWYSITAEQYKVALGIIQTYAGRKLNENQIGECLATLEENGFNFTPLEIDAYDAQQD